jgi:ABC-2 type transport system ATP-binding protein
MPLPNSRNSVSTIRTEALCKRFGDLTAIENLDLQVQAGEILALLGPNGAGKTTTVRILASVLQPTSGRAWIDGHDIVREAVTVRRLVGMLTEDPGLYRRMKAREYLTFFGQLYGLSRQECRRQSERLMAEFGLEDAWPLRLGEYSKGMRQKLALIRTMLHDPPVLLLDEPTSAMDPHSAKLVRDSILSLRTKDRAIVLCTHNLTEAEILADRIAIIRRGEIVIQGTVAQLKRELLGMPTFELQVAGSVDGMSSVIGDLAPLASQGKNWIRYRTDRAHEINPILLDRFSAAGHKVVTLSEVPRRLEEIYLQVVDAPDVEQPSGTAGDRAVEVEP